MKVIFRYQLNTTDSWNLMILYFVHRFIDAINAIMKSWNIWPWWSLWSVNADISRKTISEQNHIVYHQLRIMSLIRLFLIFHCCMLCCYDTVKFESKDMSLTLTTNFNVHFHWDQDEIMPWYFVIILWVFYLFSFRTMCCSVQGPCDIKSFKISTAYEVWFSRYRPPNLDAYSVFCTGNGVSKLFCRQCKEQGHP